jgi:ribosomal protein S18 acetylase RimI-like enzyme
MEYRRAGPGDEPAVAEVHVLSWQAAYRGLLPDEYLDVLQPEERAARYTFSKTGPDEPITTVALDGTFVCGFVTTGPCRDDDRLDGAKNGEVYALYVHPRWWDRGVGRALIEIARQRLESDDFGAAVLWVLVGNERAQRFYGADGWQPDGGRRTQEVHGIDVDEVRYRRPLP